jgi:hypothetical protein
VRKTVVKGKTSQDPKKMIRSIWLVLTILLMLCYSLQNVDGAAYYSMLTASQMSVSSPPVILQAGTSGSNAMYANSTSAKVSTVAPAPAPTYYPNNYNVVTGTYLSGSVPASVQTVDANYFIVRSAATATSTTWYNPSGYNLIGSTALVSGSTSDLTSDNAAYMTFRTYASAASGQTLYTHQETTTIGGTSYYLEKSTSADSSGTSLSASMASTGRQLLGESVYQLTGTSSIPASTWTMYYRAWRSTDPSIAYGAVGSGNNGAGSTSVSWSHTTGSGSNRIMIVGVSIRDTTVNVSSISYGAQSLAFARADSNAGYVRSEIWYLIAPASGTATVTVTLSGTSMATGGSCTYTGVAQTSPIDANAGGTGKSNLPSQSVTVNTANSWLLGHIAVTGSSKTVSSEGSGQTMRWDQVTTGGIATDRNQGHGSDKGPVGTGSQTMSWGLSGAENYAVSVVAFKPASSAIGHVDVDILIRQADGTIRTTVATNVANSGGLTSAAATLSGTYSWTAYNVVDQTDYLEIDYYADVTTALTGMSAYLRVDDNTLALPNQTRTTNIFLPSEFTSEVEFTGSSNTQNWYQLVWTVDSAWTAGSVSTTVQVYNYTLGGYPTSGSGYYSYTSSATANTDETKIQTITTNQTRFRDGSGNWKIKVKGVKSTTTQFDFKADWVEFKPSYYSEYTVSTEFLFSSMTTNTPSQLNFTVVSEYDLESVSVTIQVWNYSSSAYVISGEGYQTYSSSGTNETKLLSINTNPQLYSSNGNAKIKLIGILTTTTQYQQKANQVKLVYSYTSSSTYDYVLKIVNQVSDAWKIRLKAYSQSSIARLTNCTIYFRSSSDGTSRQIYIENGAYVNQTGPWYDLPASPAERYIIVALEATNSEISHVYVYLEILVPDITTYAQYVITFEIT